MNENKEIVERVKRDGIAITEGTTSSIMEPSNDTDIPSTTLSGEILNKLLSDKNDEFTREQLPLFVLFGMLMFVGIIGNSLVIHVYWHSVRNSSKKTFIMALALLDLGVCVLVIPFELYDLRNQLLFYNATICKAMRLLEYATVVAAGLVLVSVSFERYYFLCKAFQEFTPTKSKIICAVCTLIAVVVASPSTVFAGLKSRTVHVGNITITGSECSMDSEKIQSGFLKRVYYYVLAFIFFICIILLISIYIVIARLLMKYRKGEVLPNMSLIPRARCSRDESSGDGSLTKHQSSRNGGQSRHSPGSIIVFFSVTVVFILSFLPHIVLRILLFFDSNLLGENLVYNLVVRSYLISNVSNPFIYSILNKSFRKQLKKTFMRMSLCFFKARRATIV